MFTSTDQAEKINVEEVVEDLKSYANTRFKLLRLEATQRGAEFLSGLISIFLIFILLLLVILFFSLAAASYLSVLLENKYAGFLIIAGFYLITAIILWLGRKKLLEHAVREKLIRLIFNSH